MNFVWFLTYVGGGAGKVSRDIETRLVQCEKKTTTAVKSAAAAAEAAAASAAILQFIMIHRTQ